MSQPGDLGRRTTPTQARLSGLGAERDGQHGRGAGPVLLVDDLVVTGWTLTLAAVALREAGASAVLPVALGTQA